MYWIEKKTSSWYWIMKDLDPVERFHSEDEAKIRIFELMKRSDIFFNPSSAFKRKYFFTNQLINYDEDI